MKTLHHIPISLTLQAPILVKGTSPSTFGLDATVARDFRSDRPLLPGSLIKGKVRETLHRLGLTGIDHLFGDTGAEKYRQGSLFFGDLITHTPEQEGRLHRVALDPDLKSAKAQMLRELECPYAAGTPVLFQGHVSHYGTTEEAGNLKIQLQMALSFLNQVGSEGGTGLGRVLEAEVGEAALQTPVPADPTPMGPEALTLRLEPQGPLCFSQHHVGNNLFESQDLIPGAALAGAVMSTAKQLGLDSELKPYIDRIRFRHAFPCLASNGERPVVLPHSTIKAGGQFMDVAHLGKPHLVRNEAPKFPVDWKGPDLGETLGRLGWASPAREIRVRTAIDAVRRMADKGRKAGSEGGKLFALEVVHPFASGCPDCPVVWRSQVDLAALEPGERPQATRLLGQVLSQLGFLGKTKAFAKVQMTPLGPPPQVNLPGETLALVLQTPALLADPRYQSKKGRPIHGVLDAAQQKELYGEAWSELSGGSLELTHAFARQRLAGGEFLQLRFLQRKPYNPWLLTEEGSVFVFTVKNETEAREKLQQKLLQWLATGLELPHWAQEAHGVEWSGNPFLPWNGYGEIALHEPTFSRPAPGDLTEISIPPTERSR